MLFKRHKELGFSQQIDYDKFYQYSIITHSTTIEGSTVTEVEAQLLFDEGITSSKRTLQEQNMKLDLQYVSSVEEKMVDKDTITTEAVVNDRHNWICLEIKKYRKTLKEVMKRDASCLCLQVLLSLSIRLTN